jgi:hypothetical protein
MADSLKDLMQRIAQIEEGKEDDKESLKGFDSRTMRALTKIKAKYPNAPDDLAALLRHVTNVDKDSDDADDKHITRIQELENRVDSLEKKLTLILRKK